MPTSIRKPSRQRYLKFRKSYNRLKGKGTFRYNTRIRPINNRIHKFTFIKYVEQEPIPCGVGIIKSMVFTLKEALGSEVASMTATFDQYRIKGVKVTWVPKFNGQLLTNTTGGGYQIPELWSCIDLDDSNAINAAQMVEHWGLKRCRFLKEYKRFLKPRFQTQIYETLTSTGYGLGNRKTWLDVDDNEIPHYGLKYLVTPPNPQNPTDDQVIYFDMYIKYYLEFRGKI